MPHEWKTLPDGAVEVDGAPLVASSLPETVWRWSDLVKRHARAEGVPPSWLLGILSREAHANPSAHNRLGAVGLFQLLDPSVKGPYTDEQLKDPDINAQQAARFVRTLATTGPTWARELPAVASRYVGGQRGKGEPHPSSTSPWGMREHNGYISGVVGAHNLALGTWGPGDAPTGGGTGEVRGKRSGAARGALAGVLLFVVALTGIVVSATRKRPAGYLP